MGSLRSGSFGITFTITMTAAMLYHDENIVDDDESDDGEALESDDELRIPLVIDQTMLMINKRIYVML